MIRLLALVGTLLGLVYALGSSDHMLLKLGIVAILFFIVSKSPTRAERRLRRLNNDPNYIWQKCRACRGRGVFGDDFRTSVRCKTCRGWGGRHVRL